MNRATRHAPKSGLPPLTRDEVRTFVLATRARSAAFDFWVAAWRLRLALRNWDPNQPRVPAGSPDGGQWMGEGGPAAKPAEPRVREAQNRTGGLRRPGTTVTDGRLDFEVGWSQATRISLLEMQVGDVMARVRELRPGWRPQPGIYETATGYERTLRDNLEEGEAEFQRLSLFNGGFRTDLPPLGRSTATTESILMSNGEWIGWREPGASAEVRTLSSREMNRVSYDLLRDAVPIRTPTPYQGGWFLTRDQCRIGLRESNESGWTLDVIETPSLRHNAQKVRFHVHVGD